MDLRRTLGAALLVTGTSVGAGMLAIPVVTAEGGFFPATAIFLLCWFVMTATGLLYLEICIKMPPNTNIISMTKEYLGNKGKALALVIYLFLFYCLSIAYISGGVSFIHSITNNGLADPIAIFSFVIVTMFFVYQGAKMVDKINIWLMLGLVSSYIFFVIMGFKHIEKALLTTMQWSKAYSALPVILVSFGYQGLIPSLSDYLKKDVKSLRIAVILGTSLTFIIYFIWECLVLGIVPLDGENGLLMAQAKGHSALQPLSYLTKAESMHKVGQFFSFFAITTSFLGISLGLFDFISDGLHLAKHGWDKIIVTILTFLPPTIISLINPHLFLIALDYAGGIGGSLLLVLLPALLAWQARYVKKINRVSISFGGKGFLFFIYIFVFIVVALSLYQQYIRF